MNLVQDIKTKLNIQGGGFIDAEIESYIEGIKPEDYLEFFKALSGDDYEYKNAMDRIAITAKRFKGSYSDSLFSGTKELAKEYYALFYSVSASMLDYCTANRNRVGSDRDFFTTMNFENLRDKNGAPVFGKQQLYVLNKIGGGAWLLDIKLATNSKEVEDKIERIIKNAITEKYMKPKYEAIDNKVRKLIKG